MEEKELKTTPKQRFFIILIAILMLGSIVASYIAIVLSGNNNTAEGSTEVDEAKLAEYEEAYKKAQDEFTKATKKDYEKFLSYKNKAVKAYNETSANENGVQSKDLEKGSGDKIGDNNYLAYYIGWCADESVFDSSFDNNDKPTGFSKALDPSAGMIEGWNQGVTGMRFGGVREITIPGELAYGDQMEICGGYNKPLKFLVMTIENKDPIKSLSSKVDEAFMRYQYAQYGIDYDDVKENTE